VAEAERAAAAEATAAAEEEAARQKAECVTWGVGSFQCPRKYCEPKETMHNMDALFDGKVRWEGRNPNPIPMPNAIPDPDLRITLVLTPNPNPQP
jgi:hypothetical protein